ncbi:MAG: branched-chain amino acid ABC transporter permease [Actinobacteria bacterium]|nr:branched-chain amino acid ABC transporter permease [Actinomycetota bacterium]
MFFQYLINGLSIGSVYALIAIGYNMVYGILELLNFAHGDVYAVGCFVTFSLIMLKQNIFLAIICGMLIGFIINTIVERFAYRPVRFSGRITPTISAVGIAYIMRNIIQGIWGPETYRFDIGFRGTYIQYGNFIFGTLQIYIFIIAMAFMLLISFLLKRTKIGQSIIAISQSIPTSALVGVPVNRTISMVYGIGGALGVIGGILFCSYYESIFLGIGFMLGTMKAWMSSIIGGIGSLKGAVIGALILGSFESFIGGYISTPYRDSFVWAFFIIFILIRPKGLYPSQISEKV